MSEQNAQVERLTLAKAITRGLDDAMADNRKVVLIGEDIGKLGGVYRVTEGLLAKHGQKRVMDSPLGEAGIVGTSIGMAMRGYRPVAEIQFDGFVFPAYNQITTQLAKIHNRSDKKIRCSGYDTYSLRRRDRGGRASLGIARALFAHTAGLRIVTPSSPHDAYWMTRKSIECDDPVIIFEPKRRYWLKGEVNFVDTDFDPFQAQVVREGTDATIVAYGPLVPVALAAAEAAVEDGRSIEVIDLRSISPMDVPTVAASVVKTGRLIVAHEAPTFGGVGGELAAAITERCFYSLQAPVLRVGGYYMPYPVPRTEDEYVPDIDRILEAVDRSF